MDRMVYLVNDGRPRKLRKRDTVLPLLHTGTVSPDTSESDTGRIRLTTPDGFHFRYLKDYTRVFACFSQVFLTFGTAIGFYSFH